MPIFFLHLLLLQLKLVSQSEFNVHTSSRPPLPVLEQWPLQTKVPGTHSNRVLHLVPNSLKQYPLIQAKPAPHFCNWYSSGLFWSDINVLVVHLPP